MRYPTFVTAVALAAVAGTALPSAVAAQAGTVAPAPKYSSQSTQLGALFADPAAKAVLDKHIPDLASKPDILDRASGMTLKELQEAIKTYAPDVLNDKVLAAIDADLALIK